MKPMTDLGMTTYTVSLDIDNHWLVATDQNGASQIIARDVDLGLAWLLVPGQAIYDDGPDVVITVVNKGERTATVRIDDPARGHGAET